MKKIITFAFLVTAVSFGGMSTADLSASTYEATVNTDYSGLYSYESESYTFSGNWYNASYSTDEEGTYAQVDYCSYSSSSDDEGIASDCDTWSSWL